MKKGLLYIFIIVYLICNLYAQEDNYIPLFNKDGVQKWSELYDHRDGNHWALHTTIASNNLEDTIIENLNYKKLVTHVLDVKNNDTTEYYYNSYVREENKKIFCLSEYNGELLLFDFSLSIGDTFTAQNNIPNPKIFEIKNIDTIEINGQARKRFYVGVLGYEKYINWIEGTGCTSGLLVTPSVVYRGANHTHIYMECHLHNDEILYNWANRCNNLLDIDEIISNANNLSPKISVFPNPATNFINVNISPYIENNYVFNLFDIQGNKIIEQPLVTNNQLIATKKLNEGSYIYTITLNNNIIQKNILIIAK